MLRPLIWLAIGFALVPILSVAAAFLTMTNPHPVELPAAGIATACLYLFAADLGWTLGRRTLPFGAVAAIAAVVLLGWGVPAIVNARVGAASRSAAAADTAPASIGNPDVIALLTPYEHTRTGKWQVETDCEILCQRLLYKGDRRAVLMGATPASGSPADATGLVRYAVERRPSCPPVKVPEAGVLSGQMQYGNSHATSETVESRIAAGDCLIARPGTIAEADVATVKSKPDGEAWLRAGSNAGPLAYWRSAAFRRTAGGWERIGQATDRRFSRALSPLRLRLTGLASEEDAAASDDPYMIEHLLAPWLSWPQGMPGGSAGPPRLPAAATARR